jgi:hypothetical protein
MLHNHPILFYFGTTDKKEFPLALMIGREPNTDMTIVDEKGPYDFRDYPRAQFWNIAYGIVAEQMQLQAWQLKELCVRKDSSPILFANSLPIGSKFRAVDTDEKRRSVTAENAKEHIRNVFSFSDLIQRVSLVIMSGLDDEVFAASRSEVRQICGALGIQVAATPFFFGPNKAKIDLALSTADRSKLTAIGSAFLRSA